MAQTGSSDEKNRRLKILLDCPFKAIKPLFNIREIAETSEELGLQIHKKLSRVGKFQKTFKKIWE